MKRGRIQLITTTCRRCGKTLTTAGHSLTGADALKARLDRICSACITPEEEREMLEGQAQALLAQAGAGE